MADHGIRRLHLNFGVHCNVRCVMCYQTSFSRELNMPPVIYREHLKPLYPELRIVKVQGGEPTIMSNCRDFCRMMRDYPQAKLSITTNGIYFNQFWLDTFREQAAFVNVSLNAASREAYDQIVIHGDFAKAVGNLAKLGGFQGEGGPKVAMSMVILPANVREILQFLELGVSLGVRQINYGVDPLLSFKSLPDKGALNALLAEAYAYIAWEGVQSEGLDAFARGVGYPVAEELKPINRPRCAMPLHDLMVDQQGDVRVCCDTWQIIGNTYQQPILDIVNGARRAAFQRRIAKDNYLWCDPKCPDNRNPNRLALYHKYFCLARRDPKEFAGKVKQKLSRYGKL